KLITKVVTAATTQVIPAAEPVVVAVSTPISAIKPKVLKVVPAALTVSTRKRKGEEEESLAQTKDAQTIDVQSKGAPAKRIQYIRRYHGYKKKPQSEFEARKNMIAYLKNTEGFKMAFFKG
nr:hypothetical protein [Tanacetum cinerariifolium]